MQKSDRRQHSDRRGRRVNPAARRFSLKRLSILLSSGVFCLGFIYAIFATGFSNRVQEWSRERLVRLSANAGYRLENLYVEGRHYTDAEIVRGIVNLKKGAPLFSFDPETVRAMLVKVSWIKDVTVRREMPSSIYIAITERDPLALWQYEGKVKVIDSDGVVLTSELDSFSNLPMVVGKNANTRAAELIALLNAEPALRKQVITAVWVGDRRWDLTTDKGLIIKLPENDLGLALKRLSDTEKQDQLLQKDIAVIDLREADRLVVRTKPGAVTEYKASFSPGQRDL